MNGDLERAVAMLAADNARMCDILIAAEDLAKAAEAFERGIGKRNAAETAAEFAAALARYKVVRNGQ